MGMVKPLTSSMWGPCKMTVYMELRNDWPVLDLVTDEKRLTAAFGITSWRKPLVDRRGCWNGEAAIDIGVLYLWSKWEEQHFAIEDNRKFPHNKRSGALVVVDGVLQYCSPFQPVEYCLRRLLLGLICLGYDTDALEKQYNVLVSGHDRMEKLLTYREQLLASGVSDL